MRRVGRVSPADLPARGRTADRWSGRIPGSRSYLHVQLPTASINEFLPFPSSRVRLRSSLSYPRNRPFAHLLPIYCPQNHLRHRLFPAASKIPPSDQAPAVLVEPNKIYSAAEQYIQRPTRRARARAHAASHPLARPLSRAWPIFAIARGHRQSTDTLQRTLNVRVSRYPRQYSTLR